jgi:hypothetical protein
MNINIEATEYKPDFLARFMEHTANLAHTTNGDLSEVYYGRHDVMAACFILPGDFFENLAYIGEQP